MIKNKDIVIQKNANLFTLEINNIDAKIVSLIEEIYFENYPKSKSNEYLISRFIHLLNGFCYLKKYKLNYISIVNQDLSAFFSEYLYFLKYSVDTETNRFIRILNKIVDNFNGEIKLILNDIDSISFNFDKESIKYLNGWKLNIERKKSYEYLQICEYSKIHSFFDAEKIEKILNQANQAVNVYLFNELILFLNKDKISVFNIEKKTMIEFIQYIFSIRKSININRQKKEWNALIGLLINYFNLNENYDLKFISSGYMHPNEMRIKNIGEKQYKDKLISLVPLEIKDEKALAILKDKVNQDISLLKEWADHMLTDFSNNRLTKRCLNASDYNMSPLDVRKKYGLKAHHNTKEFFDKETIFNEKHLFAICALLIESHPEITESFIKKCSFDSSLIEGINNESLFLISKKSRRGPELAEQKISLTENTKLIIEKYLKLTQDLRKNLNLNKNKLKDVMFICCSNNHPLEIKQPLEFKTSYVQKSIYEFLIDKGYSENDSKYYSNSISLSKIRSTKAVQIYFQTENTSKMAEALGHHKYNSNLLSHYLPKSILDFFQERWIRIFQKGIILESIKDSKYILAITKFNNMDEVNEFLKNHTFKFKDSKSAIINGEEDLIKNKTSYISINEINLNALASINEAVNTSSKKELINESSFYWSSFYEKLTLIIKSDYTNFIELLDKSIKNKNPAIFNEVIYE